MLEYNIKGAFGKDPDKKLVKTLQSMGVILDVSRRPDNLLDIKLGFDEDKIMKTKSSPVKKGNSKKGSEISSTTKATKKKTI